jgi:hypothetical protein
VTAPPPFRYVQVAVARALVVNAARLCRQVARASGGDRRAQFRAAAAGLDFVARNLDAAPPPPAAPFVWI